MEFDGLGVSATVLHRVWVGQRRRGGTFSVSAHGSWEFVDIERAAVRGVRQGIPLVTVSSWTMVLHLPRRTPRVRKTATVLDPRVRLSTS